jgi:tetratricopeptide (TPR) repeat protein
MVLEDVLVTIYPHGSNVPVGAGLLVERDLVLTCAHVVNDALGRAQAEAQRPPTGAKVWVKQHAPASSAISASVDAADDAWSAPPPTRQTGADLCLLRLDAGSTSGFKSIQLRDLRGEGLPIAYRAVGFPKDWDVDISVGQIQGRDSNGLYILRPDSATAAVVKTATKSGFFHGEERTPGIISSGFSGGPVEVNGTIVGLIAESRSSVADATAYMIPVSAFPQRLAKEPPHSKPPLFRKDETFNVLFLPFDPIEKITTKEIKPERAILKRLTDMQHGENLALQVRYREEGILPISFEDGAAIGRKLGAHLVIWGDYFQSLTANSTNIALRWALVDVNLANIMPTGKVPVQSVESLTLLTEGYLQEDIDYVIFWCLAHMEMKMAHYERAIERLNRVVSQFGNKFQGVVSRKTDWHGIQLTINEPALQVCFYFGHCYQCLKQYDKAIPYWDRILIGTAGTKGGNFAAWDALALAITNKNPEQTNTLLHILFSKAHAQLLLGDQEAGLGTLRQIYRNAKLAQNTPQLYERTFARVIEWLRNDLKLPETESDSAKSSTGLIFEALRREGLI